MADLDVYEKQGFGNKSGFGDNPALLIVDFVNGFANPEEFGGGNISDAIKATQNILGACRKQNVPVAFSRVVYADDGSDNGVFCIKAPGLKKLTEKADISQVVKELSPIKGEYVLRKTQPSAFFGTDLAGWLISHKVDTVMVAGCTTSGCVRASVIDSMSNNFHTIVITDCVGDRAIGPHEANLFDMEQKYADLASSAEIIDILESEL